MTNGCLEVGCVGVRGSLEFQGRFCVGRKGFEVACWLLFGNDGKGCWFKVSVGTGDDI